MQGNPNQCRLRKPSLISLAGDKVDAVLTCNGIIVSAVVVNSYFCKILTMAILTSSKAKRNPKQLRGPLPNGI